MWVFSNFSTIHNHKYITTNFSLLFDIAKVTKIDLGIGLDKPQQFVTCKWSIAKTNRSKIPIYIQSCML